MEFAYPCKVATPLIPADTLANRTVRGLAELCNQQGRLSILPLVVMTVSCEYHKEPSKGHRRPSDIFTKRSDRQRGKQESSKHKTLDQTRYQYQVPMCPCISLIVFRNDLIFSKEVEQLR